MDENDNNGASYKWIDEFEDFCSSDDLSLDGLRKMVNDASRDDLENSLMCLQDTEYKHKRPIRPLKLQSLHKSNFLHRVCMNENVTLEMMAYLLDVNLLDTNPFAAHTGGKCLDIPDLKLIYMNKRYNTYIESAYPIHLVCYNKECPNEVIDQLLQIRECRNQLTQICHMDFNWGNTDLDCYHYGGTPLHYYLSRTSNVDLDIVKQLAVNSELLLSVGDDTKCTPIYILMNNSSIGDMYDVVKYLVESNPDSLKAKDKYDRTPLSVACLNKNITTRTVKLLLEAWPESIHQRSSSNALPIHKLCEAHDMDDAVAIDILKLLLEPHPNLVSQSGNFQGYLPLHKAATNKSPAFCKLLVDAYPESVKVDGDGRLPFHCACNNGRPDTVEYLFGLYPECTNIRTDGFLPIHEAASDPGENTAEIVNFLLLQDPDCLSKSVVSDFNSDDEGSLPLHLVCSSRDDALWDKSNVMELLFDLYPEAILIRNEEEQLPIDVARKRLLWISNHEIDNKECYQQRVQDQISFLHTQMNYARKAQDQNALRAPDSNGMLPLHNALYANSYFDANSAPLGSIKLLVKGNADAVDVPDRSGMYPLDIACQFSTVGVVKYLAKLSPDRLNACDVNKNYPLHHACRGGNCEVISYLLETPMASASVSERNVNSLLPIQLFCDIVNRSEEEKDTPEYTETIWRLLTAYPEAILNW